MKVITNIPGKPGGFWGENTEFIDGAKPSPRLTRALGKQWATRVAYIVSALGLFHRRRKCEAMVTGGGLDGRLLACLQSLVPWGRRRHVMVDCNWYVPASRLGYLVRSLELQLAARSVSSFVVWASHELQDYARAFGLPEDKFTYVPFHTTLDGYEFEIRDDGYLFAGGNYDRDYGMLVESVRNMTQPVWIATTRPELLSGIDVPANVRIEGTTNAGFRQAMAAARLVVVPMEAGLLHSGGQQTCLNAMWLGKPTIAIGRPWASDFITDRVDGFIVDYRDAAGLRRTIQWIAEHPEDAAAIARRGQARARQFPTRRCMETLYNLALSNRVDVVSEKVRLEMEETSASREATAVCQGANHQPSSRSASVVTR